MICARGINSRRKGPPRTTHQQERPYPARKKPNEHWFFEIHLSGPEERKESVFPMGRKKDGAGLQGGRRKKKVAGLAGRGMLLSMTFLKELSV